jgi:ribosomal protein S18 acetylase RimI-like enzyme
MSVRLRPLREDEFGAWAQRHDAWYVHDLVRNGGMAEDAARRKAAADIEARFPVGLSSPDNLVFVVEADGTAVGSVWFAPRDVDGERIAFLYALEIDEEHRGRGYGRDAMRLFEHEARSRGFAKARLNVFGGNDPARALYRSLAYAELSVWMGKDL